MQHRDGGAEGAGDGHLDEGTIHAWLDDALDADSARDVERHAAACDRCRAAVAESRGLVAGASRIVRELDGAGRMAPGNVRSGAKSVAASPARLGGRRRFSRVERSLGALAAAAAIAAVGFTVTRERPEVRGVPIKASSPLTIAGDSTVRARDGGQSAVDEVAEAGSLEPIVAASEPRAQQRAGSEVALSPSAPAPPPSSSAASSASPMAAPWRQEAVADAARTAQKGDVGSSAAERSRIPVLRRSAAEARAADQPERDALARAGAVQPAAKPADRAPQPLAAAVARERCLRVTLVQGSVIELRLSAPAPPASSATSVWEGAALVVRSVGGGTRTYEGRWSGADGEMMMVEWREDGATRTLDLNDGTGAASLRGDPPVSGGSSRTECRPA